MAIGELAVATRIAESGTETAQGGSMPEANTTSTVHENLKGDGRAMMLSLLARGLLRAGQEINFQYKRELYLAIAEQDGKLADFDGDHYDTPSEFANEMVKRYNTEHRIRVRGSVNVNGWQNCTVEGRSLQELLDGPDPPPNQADSARGFEDSGVEGDRKRKRMSTDGGSKDEYANSRRMRRTTRLASGKIKQVDYNFRAGAPDSATGTARQQTAHDSEDEPEADDKADEKKEVNEELSEEQAGDEEKADEGEAEAGEVEDDNEEQAGSKKNGSVDRQKSASPSSLADVEIDSSEGANTAKNEGSTGGDDTDVYTEGDLNAASGWDLEEQEALLDWILSKRVLNAEILAEDSLGRSSEDIKKFIDGVTARMREAKVEKVEDVKCVAAFLGAEVCIGRATRKARKGKKAQRKGRASKEVNELKKKIEEERSKVAELEKHRKKRKREIEEVRTRLETEMQQRRDVELEKGQLMLQLNDAKEEERRKMEKCRSIEAENSSLREREAASREQLEDARQRIAALRLLTSVPTGTVAFNFVGLGGAGSDNEDHAPKRASEAPAPAPGSKSHATQQSCPQREQDQMSWERPGTDVNLTTQGETRPPLETIVEASNHGEKRVGDSMAARTSAPDSAAHSSLMVNRNVASSEENVDRLLLDIQRLKGETANLERETEEWKMHIRSEMQRQMYITECKARLEHALRLAAASLTPKRSGAASNQSSSARTPVGKHKSATGQLPPQPNLLGGPSPAKKGPNSRLPGGGKGAQAPRSTNKGDTEGEATRRKSSKDVYRSISVN